MLRQARTCARGRVSGLLNRGTWQHSILTFHPKPRAKEGSTARCIFRQWRQTNESQNSAAPLLRPLLARLQISRFKQEASLSRADGQIPWLQGEGLFAPLQSSRHEMRKALVNWKGGNGVEHEYFLDNGGRGLHEAVKFSVKLIDLSI